MKYRFYAGLFLCLCFFIAQAQEKKPVVKLQGDMGIWYEGYGLDKSPDAPSPDFYPARRPWNLLRYTFNPTLTVGKWNIPLNVSLSSLQNNFATAITGKKQTLWQYVTNPANNLGVRPKIGTTEILLGTQNLQYSDLSTGDLGVFGYGVNLSPGKFRLKVFNGVSQRPVDYLSPIQFPPNGVTGAYQRNQWMAQLGMEKEEQYFAGFNFVKSSDARSSVSAAPLPPIAPQENMVVTFLAKATTANGWKYHLELGQSFFTRDLNTPFSTVITENFQPFMKAHTSSNKDHAVMAELAKKGSDWEAGLRFNYFGAGYYTAGYPFMQTDRAEYLANLRFNIFKKKTNVTARIGQRFGNLSRIAGPELTRQLIANINTFTQFNDHLSLTASFNNYGFNAVSISGYKNVSNEIQFNPAYMWSTPKVSHLLSASYTYSKYDETVLLPPLTTTKNNTQTALLLYVPTFLAKKVSPDFNLMWFHNKATPIDLTLWSASGGLNWKPNEKISYKGQLQYSLNTVKPNTANKNLMATGGYDWNLYKKLTWQFTATVNLYRYGTELPGNTLSPPYMGIPQYFETTVRTGLNYRF